MTARTSGRRRSSAGAVDAGRVGGPFVVACALPVDVVPQHALACAARIGVDLAVDASAPELPIGQGDSVVFALRVLATLSAHGIDGVRAQLPPSIAALVEPAHGRSGALLRSTPDGRIALHLRNAAPIDLGEPVEARAVLLRRAMLKEAADSTALPPLPRDAEARARETLFGPPRTLSDPSSRKVLEAYAVPSVAHRLAETAARAAVHARTLGHPVDLRLASPDLSAIDHRALAALDLRTPGVVRDAQRALLRDARSLKADARVLGVTVARHAPALLVVRVTTTLEVSCLDARLGRVVPAFAGKAPRTVGDALFILASANGRDALYGRPLAELLARLGAVAALGIVASVEAELALDPAPAVVAARVIVGA